MLLVIKVGAQTPVLAVADSLYAIGNYTESIQQLENLQDKSDAAQLRLAKAYVCHLYTSDAVDYMQCGDTFVRRIVKQ